MSTLGELITMQGPELQEITPNYYSEAERKQAIGFAYHHYYLRLVNVGEGYFVQKTNLAITGGTEEVDLSTLDPVFHKIKLLQKNTSVGQMPLVRYERRYEWNTVIGVSSGDAYYPTWRARNKKLILEPRPVASEASSDTTGLRMEYYYLPEFPTQSTSDSFEFDSNFDTIFEPNIVLRSAISLLKQKGAAGTVSAIPDMEQRLAEMDYMFDRSMNKSEDLDFVVYCGEDYTNF